MGNSGIQQDPLATPGPASVVGRPALLAIDWGTSRLRGALLGAGGTVLAERSLPRGLLQVPAGTWPAVFVEGFGDWLRAWPHLPGLMAGMVGSRQGWVEAPYCDCPASVADLAARLTWVSSPVAPPVAPPVTPPTAGQIAEPIAGPTGVREPGERSARPLAIVPGLAWHGEGPPDLMRGEETQVFGALQLLAPSLGPADRADALLLLPGTHSKWVQVRQGRVVGFRSHMTGESYALFRRYSILARGLPALDESVDEPFIASAFDDGAARAQQPGGLLHHLFGVRSLGLFDRAAPADLASYLSGLVIGEELRAQGVAAGSSVIVVGSEALTLRYARALGSMGVPVHSVGAEASWRGLWALASAATMTR